MNLGIIISCISRLRRNTLARNTLLIILVRLMRLFLQFGYFLIIARSLGAQKYGAFVSVTALVGILSPFASWGSDHILVKYVSRKPSLLAEYWGNALLTIFFSGSVLLTFLLLSYSAFLPLNIPFIVVLFIGLSDLFGNVIIRTASRAFQAVHNFNLTAQLSILSSITRIIAALCLVTFFPQKGVVTWAGLYSISTIAAAGITLVVVQYHFGKPKLSIEGIKREFVQGFYFSASSTAATINNNIDKTMLAKLSTLQATGAYAAAYRLIHVANIPMSSLIFSSYPNFFKHGAKGIQSSVHYVKKLLPIGFAYSLAVGVAILLLAPVVPYLLGEEYAKSIEVLRWLALLPLLKCLQSLAGSTLTGADLQDFRTAMQASIALFNCLINLWLIPLYSWKGAVWATLASDVLLVLGFWGIIAFNYWEQGKGGQS